MEPGTNESMILNGRTRSRRGMSGSHYSGPATVPLGMTLTWDPDQRLNGSKMEAGTVGPG